MARLLSFPVSTVVMAATPVNGPNARNSGSNTASDGSEQAFDHIGDVVALQLDFVVRRKAAARRERGWMTAFLGGGNATRFTFCDHDRMTRVESGLASADDISWSNAKPWSNGLDWAAGYPQVSVISSAALDDGIVELDTAFWGDELGLGDYIGFMPFHFGMYTITEVISAGKYRIWPRLRKAITTTDFATLTPTLAMRPTGREAISMKRGLVATEGQSITLVEVFDYDARDYFGD